jgi:hypothetical protein
LSSAEFIEGFIPPDYLIDHVLQHGFVYSLTGAIGAGKTTIALLIAANVALNKMIGEHGVSEGKVLYFAGENSDDVRMKWIALAATMKVDPASIPVWFIPGVFKISQLETAIRQEVKAVGGLALVVIDTSAAYYEGTDDNQNVQMGEHARRLRGLSSLPGKPTILILCHPVKNAETDNLLPRGGGAFVAEMDGNLTIVNRDMVAEVHWYRKFRGAAFEPIFFHLLQVTTPKLMDSKGRPIPSIVAEPIAEAERKEIEKREARAEDALLLAMAKLPGAAISALAEAAGLRLSSGNPHKSRAHKMLKSLRREGLTKVERRTWKLTEKGVKEAKRLADNLAMAGATYG